MTALTFHYRRRYLDGSSGISTRYGPVGVPCDDTAGWVSDCRWVGPHFTDPAVGRRGQGTAIIARPAPAAWRQWLWPGAPLRLMEYFDAADRRLYYRIDFATPPLRQGPVFYQTDLYLDLFVSPDGHDYAIQDEDELAQAQGQGLIDAAAVAAVEAACATVVARVEAGTWGAWLATTCATPFRLAGVPAAPVFQHVEFAPGAADGWPA